MNEAAKEAMRAYRREWRKKNRDKVRAANERYWERKAAKAAMDAEAGDRKEAAAG